MLKNYVVDADLKLHYPGLARQLWLSQSSYATQIADGFEHVLNDVYSKGIIPRLCMVPLDLRYQTTDPLGGQPVVATETSNTIGSPYTGNNERRLVLTVVANSGSNVIKLQGSNDPNTPDTNDPSWTDVNGASITVSGSGSQSPSVVFQDQFRWYRYASIVSGSIQYSVHLVEVIFDHLIIMSAFKLIFRDFIVDPGDVWESRYKTAVDEYDKDLNLIKFGYDLNDNGTLSPDETERTGQIVFER